MIPTCWKGWKPLEFREAVAFSDLILDALLAGDIESVEAITRGQLFKTQLALRRALRATDDDAGLMELVKEKKDA